MRGRLGDVLQAEGRISREQTEWAAEVAARDGARIRSVLVAAGLVRRGELYRALARMWDCPYVDLTDAVTHPPPPGRPRPPRAHRRGLVPRPLRGRRAAAQGDRARRHLRRTSP